MGIVYDAVHTVDPLPSSPLYKSGIFSPVSSTTCIALLPPKRGFTCFIDDNAEKLN